VNVRKQFHRIFTLLIVSDAKLRSHMTSD